MQDTAENQGEELFKLYLDQRGYADYERHVTWLNPPKKPDFLVRTSTGEVVVEVKSFTTMGIFGNTEPGTATSRAQKQSLSPVRSAITTAADQLRGIPERPLVVALANPRIRPVPLMPPMIISAMYGDMSFSFPTELDGPGYWHAGRNGRLYVADNGKEHGNHAFISAVVTVRVAENVKAWAEAWWREIGAAYPTLEDKLRAYEEAKRDAPEPTVTLDVFETVSDQCVPLPAELFFHEGDTRWGVIAPGEYGLKATATV